ncbi:hypothetical protein JNUCC1_01680 [Lentibacillus sp. JNUCC-1]|uniref:hypothetical protein n=1 Tax=Lentibacillus sp. JNUCC-1 TaxID=2654513 RepID=UPI0012E7B169|nr:hypothetical protein [Lentibacillus sp. JNUCC-1]MUV37874.1 hypothetical protein [Lentibacillus sp. JNUCC-1]
MSAWMFWVIIALITVVLLYAIFSIYMKKPVGLYISAGFHVVMGALTLPSIGLYVLGLAVIEIIVGVSMTAKYRRGRS